MKVADFASLEAVQTEIRMRPNDSEYREAVLTMFTPREMFTFLLKNYTKLDEYKNQNCDELVALTDFLTRRVKVTE